MFRKLLSGGLAALTVQPSIAQATDPDIQEPVIVTGVRFDTPADQVGRSVSIITSDEIEFRQQRFVFDALQAAPGVQIIRSGSFGALSSVSIRGLPSAQTLVVQDGIVLNNPASFGNAFNFANFDTSDIERIEVLRGAQSTLYGSDAIGGVINIVTENGAEGLGGAVFAEGGSFGTFRGAATVRGGSERLSGRVTVSGVTTDGFSTADAVNGNTEDDGFDNLTVSSKAAFDPAGPFRFDAVVRYQDSTNEFDGFSFTTFLPTDADNVAETEELSVAGFAYADLLDGAWENRVSVSYARTDQFNTESDVATFDALGERISYEYQGKVKPISAATVIYGVEYEEQESDVDLGFGADAELETISGYGLVQAEPLPGVTLTAGLRHDATSGLEGVSETSDTTASGSASIKIPYVGGVLRGSYTEGFRTPSAGEISMNPLLESEVSAGWDIGLERAFFNGRAILQATYFNQDIDDLIGFDPITFTPVNIEEFDTQGVEVSGELKIFDSLSASAAYTFTDAVNATSTLAAALQPEHRLNVEIDYRPTDRLSLGANILFNGDEEFFGSEVDGFVLLNLRAAYILNDAFEVFARIENVTDAEYQDNPGFGTAPVSAFGGVRARF